MHTLVWSTGIGLYIVTKMIENARRSMEVKKQGRGWAQFKVYFKS